MKGTSYEVVPISSFAIDPEFRDFLRQRTEDERSALRMSLEEHGQLDAMKIWDEENKLIDGYGRYAELMDMGVSDVTVSRLSFRSRADVLQWIFDNQAGRRNLTRAEIVRALEKVRTERAKEGREKMSEAKKEEVRRRKGEGFRNSENLETTKPAPIRTDAEMAKKAGMSTNQYQDIRMILEKGTPEQIRRIDEPGQKNSLNRIKAEIREGDRADEDVECTVCGCRFPRVSFKSGSYVCHRCLRNRTRHAGGPYSSNQRKTSAKPENTDNQTIHGDPPYPEETFRAELEAGVRDFRAFIKNMHRFHPSYFNGNPITIAIDEILKQEREETTNGRKL